LEVANKIITEATTDPLICTSKPVLGHSFSIHVHNLKQIIEEMSSLLSQLFKYKEQLFQYAEINKSLSEELAQLEGCQQLARDKQRMYVYYTTLSNIIQVPI
jgi:hypothetical protein